MIRVNYLHAFTSFVIYIFKRAVLVFELELTFKSVFMADFARFDSKCHYT